MGAGQTVNLLSSDSGGSTPSLSIKFLGVVQFSRTLDLGSRGRRSEACHSDSMLDAYNIDGYIDR